jgi:hypothetical protein
MKQNSNRKQSYIYKKNAYSWNHKKKVYILWNTYIPCIFPHPFEIHLDFQFFQSSFKTPQHQKKISFPNSFVTNIKKMGLNPKMFPTTHGSSPSYFNFFTLFCFLIFYLQSQPTNSPLKIIFNIFLNEWKYFSPTHLVEENITNYTKIMKIFFKHFYTYY